MSNWEEENERIAIKPKTSCYGKWGFNIQEEQNTVQEMQKQNALCGSGNREASQGRKLQNRKG